MSRIRVLVTDDSAFTRQEAPRALKSAQDKATGLVYGMPKAAVELGVIDTVSPLDRIAAVINRWLDPNPG